MIEEYAISVQTLALRACFHLSVTVTRSRVTRAREPEGGIRAGHSRVPSAALVHPRDFHMPSRASGNVRRCVVVVSHSHVSHVVSDSEHTFFHLNTIFYITCYVSNLFL